MVNQTPLVIAAQPLAQLTYQELDILHALRGFCAFYVVVFHAKFVLWSGGTEYLKAFPMKSWSISNYLLFLIDMASSAGVEMVIFFFVLSGFFIRYAQQKKHRPALKFYVNRIVRIYPPFVFSLVLAALVLWGVIMYRPELLTTKLNRELNIGLLDAWQEFRRQPVETLTKSMLFLRVKQQYFCSNTVYWSLLPEAVFYLLVPFAFWRIRLYYILSTALFFISLAASHLHLPFSGVLSSLMPFNGYFALGVGLYDLVTQRPAIIQFFKHYNRLALFFAVTALLGAVIGLAALRMHLPATLLAAVLAVLSVLILLADKVNRQNIFVRFFHKVGLFSFSLYLYHLPLLFASYAILTLFTGSLYTYTHWYWLFIPLVVATCYALYHVTERLAIQYFRGV